MKTSALQYVVLTYNHDACPPPISENVTLDYLQQQLQTPRAEWDDANPTHHNPEQRATFNSALSTVMHMCSLDPTDVSLKRLCGTMENMFMQTWSSPVHREAAKEWAADVTQCFQGVDGGDSEMVSAEEDI